MLPIIWPFLGAFFISSTYADTMAISWTPSSVRENGDPIVGITSFEIVQNGETVYEGDIPRFEVELESGVAYWFELYQLEDGLRSKPILKRILIDRVPPKRPNWVD